MVAQGFEKSVLWKRAISAGQKNRRGDASSKVDQSKVEGNIDSHYPLIYRTRSAMITLHHGGFFIEIDFCVMMREMFGF